MEVCSLEGKQANRHRIASYSAILDEYSVCYVYILIIFGGVDRIDRVDRVDN